MHSLSFPQKVDTLTLKCVTFVTFVTLRRCAPRCFDINANALLHCLCVLK